MMSAPFLGFSVLISGVFIATLIIIILTVLWRLAILWDSEAGSTVCLSFFVMREGKCWKAESRITRSQGELSTNTN